VRQAAFVERYAPEWDAFEEWLKRRSGLRRGAHTDEPQAALSDAAVPAR
jgi:hypothetical protein